MIQLDKTSFNWSIKLAYLGRYLLVWRQLNEQTLQGCGKKIDSQFSVIRNCSSYLCFDGIKSEKGSRNHTCISVSDWWSLCWLLLSWYLVMVAKYEPSGLKSTCRGVPVWKEITYTWLIQWIKLHFFQLNSNTSSMATKQVTVRQYQLDRFL